MLINLLFLNLIILYFLNIKLIKINLTYQNSINYHILNNFKI